MSCCGKLRGLLVCFVLLGAVLIVQGSDRDVFAANLVDPPPILKITMNQATYIDGQTVATSQFLLENLASVEARVEFAVWLELPGVEPISVLNLGADNTFVLPPSVSQELGPLTLFTVSPSFPRGGYTFNSRMLNPVTKKFLSEDLNTFLLQ